MRSKWKNPVSYSAFSRRLKEMTLAEAIERPRVEYQVRIWKSNPIQDRIRRSQTLKSERVAIVDLDDLSRIEHNRIRMPKPKPTLWKRFISLFK